MPAPTREAQADLPPTCHSTAITSFLLLFLPPTLVADVQPRVLAAAGYEQHPFPNFFISVRFLEGRHILQDLFLSPQLLYTNTKVITF